jgi:PKD repeat protein
LATKNGEFIRPSGLNTTSALNSAGGTLVEDMFLYLEEGSDYQDDVWEVHVNPIINPNDNIKRLALLSLDGQLNNPVIVQEGAINGEELMRGISIGGLGWENFSVNGGLMISLDPEVQDARAIEIRSKNGVIDGFRSMVRSTSKPWSEIGLRADEEYGWNYTVKNTVANVIRDDTGTAILENNMTVDEYQASLGENVPPTADFNIQDILGEGSYNFFAYDSIDPDGYIIRYDWSFSDGSTDRLPYASHHFDNPGTYDVTLTVTDERGATDTTTKTITVSDTTEPTPTPPDLTSPQDCSAITSEGGAEPGYSSPMVPNSGVLGLQAECDSENVYITLGSQDNAEITYPYGFYWDGSNWQNLVYTTAGGSTGAWARGPVEATIPQSNISSPGFVLGYVCRWNGQGYSCPSNWMLQKVE